MQRVHERLIDWQAAAPPLVMGVLNTTPDSFSDGGTYFSPEGARERVDALLAEGADLIDIGAESSRPGSREVDAAEQILRLGSALEHAVRLGAFVSVDTTSAEVARHCLERGAQMVNDVSCLRDAALAEVAAAKGAWLVISHSRAPMSQMAGFSQWPDDDYTDIVDGVMADWGKARERALQAGVRPDRLVFDPGLGFSKNTRHCFDILARLREFSVLGVPMLSGPSRKSFIADVDGAGVGARLGGTIAACIASMQAGAACVRVHDVHPTRQALAVWARISPTGTG